MALLSWCGAPVRIACSLVPVAGWPSSAPVCCCHRAESLQSNAEWKTVKLVHRDLVNRMPDNATLR